MCVCSCRCSGSLLEDGKLLAAVEAGLQSAMYVDLVVSVCSELKRLNQMQESVSKPAGAGRYYVILHHMLKLVYMLCTYLNRCRRCRLVSAGNERVPPGALLPPPPAHLRPQLPR